jgi:hypothetical protein
MSEFPPTARLRTARYTGLVSKGLWWWDICGLSEAALMKRSIEPIQVFTADTAAQMERI